MDGVFFCAPKVMRNECITFLRGTFGPPSGLPNNFNLFRIRMLSGKVVYDIIYAKQFVYPLFNEFTKKLNNLCETNSCAKQHCMTPAISRTRERVVYVYDAGQEDV